MRQDSPSEANRQEFPKSFFTKLVALSDHYLSLHAIWREHLNIENRSCKEGGIGNVANVALFFILMTELYF